jgi:hypothetical protein
VHFFAELVVGHRSTGDTEDGDPGREAAFVSQAIESREELAFGQVPVGAKNDNGALGELPFKP